MASRSPLPVDPAAVAAWTIGSGRRGALLLHGFAGTPPELRRLGEHLAAAGWRCDAPLLTGHGTTPEDLDRTTWRDWAGSARAALDQLAADCDQLVVAGQSMGGTLALHLAATVPGIAAVATLAAPIWFADPRLKVIGVLRHFHRWHQPDPDDVDLYWPEAVDELWSYPRRSTRSIQELLRLMATVRRDLPMVRPPVLLFHGGRDRSVDPRNATDIASRLVCSRAVELSLHPRSGHALSVDVDREEINRQVAAWFERWAPSMVTAPPAEVVEAS